MTHHGGVYRNADIFVKMQVFLRGFDFTTVFQNGSQAAISGFGLVSILFLFQTLIYYINYLYAKM